MGRFFLFLPKITLMKNITLLVLTLILCSFTSFAQMPVDEETGKLQYQEVVQESGTQQEFFTRAVAWVNKNYKNPASVTSLRDPHTGVIEGNHRLRLQFHNEDGTVRDGEMILYSFKIEFKDGRYRYTFNDFVVKKQSRFDLERWTDKDSPDYRPDNMYVQENIHEHITELINSLKEQMAPPPEEVEDEW